MQAFEQNISPRQMMEYQFEMLRQQLAYAAAGCSFYAAWNERPLTCLADLARLPFTTAEDIITRGQEMLCVTASQVQRIVSLRSSGSCGPWKRLYFTAADLQQTVDFFSIGMKYLCAAGDEVMICMPGVAEDGVGRLLAQGLRRMGAKPLLYGPIDDYAAAADCLRQTRPHTIVGLPAQLRRLALTAPECAPANLLLSADRIGPPLRQTIERVWGCPVFEHYGLTESGLGLAVECPAHQGLHIRHDVLYVEIVDPVSLRPLPAGQWGEIVFTTLKRQAMPLIRYRSGDLGRLLDMPCSCGGLLPRLDSIRGRRRELERPLNIYDLDDLLLADDRILDYSVHQQEDELNIQVAGDMQAARSLLRQAYPGLKLRVSAGSGFATSGTRKRSIEAKTPSEH